MSDEDDGSGCIVVAILAAVLIAGAARSCESADAVKRIERTVDKIERRLERIEHRERRPIDE